MNLTFTGFFHGSGPGSINTHLLICSDNICCCGRAKEREEAQYFTAFTKELSYIKYISHSVTEVQNTGVSLKAMHQAN